MSIFPTKILLATDGSDEATLAVRTAADMTQKTGSELHVVYVGPSLEYVGMGPPEIGDIPAPTQEQLSAEARELLDAEIGQVKAYGGTVAQAHLGVGAPDREIVALAEDIGAGLVVVGSRGRGGIRRALMGSVSDSVVRHAHCPVFVVRGEPVILPTKILLATDGSAEAQQAASTAASLTKSTGSELHVAYVGHLPPVFYESPGAWVLDPDLQRRMEEGAKKEAGARLDEQVRQVVRPIEGEVAGVHVRLGRPEGELVRLAEELGVGLIVLGSRGLGPLRRALMGSVSDSVIRHAHCPVMVVREEKSERKKELDRDNTMLS